MSRPRGRKNNATLIKEAEAKKALKLCEGTALVHAPAIVQAMAEKAKGGDVAAAKLILDRVYPAMRQVDDRGDVSRSIVINITGDAHIGEQHADHSHEGATVDGESAEPDGEVPVGDEGGKVLALRRGEEGHR